ncbi:methyltransferase domain-containing protein [Lophiotrema nucula]|uniref:Methyltransferase domain-containing protein n=1 Tax=Lophiotrema nucula TaxID=690887 RepID=A0A6A5ZM07_9PLEO|nr:methyltransferase domain-containing protein [Lophiotrema nucula]
MPSVSYGYLDPDTVLETFGDARDATDSYIGKSKLLNTYSAEWMPKSDQVAIAIFCNALEELGCPIRSAATGTKLERVTSESHAKLLNHMYAQLERKARLIRINGNAIIRTDVPCPPADIETPLNELLRDRPGQETEVRLMKLMGRNYGQCIGGKVDAVQLLFGDEETRALLTKTYSSSEANAVLLKQLADFIEAVAGTWPTKTAPLRILEVGAGTGGTTSWLLPALARLDVPIVYTFTDIGPVFVTEASKTFKDYPFVEYKVLDIEQEPGPELLDSQHIIIGTNVIHATKDVIKSLKNVHKLLRPDGFVLIGEMVEQMLWADIVYGLISGFWRFEDGRRQATQTVQGWEKTFTSAGYGHVDWTQGKRPEALLHALIFAMASDPEI